MNWPLIISLALFVVGVAGSGVVIVTAIAKSHQPPQRNRFQSHCRLTDGRFKGLRLR